MTEIEIFSSNTPVRAAIEANKHARKNKKEIVSASLTPPENSYDRYRLVVVFKFDKED